MMSRMSDASSVDRRLGAGRDSASSHIYGFMPLRRFLLADRPAPEAICPLASQLLFGDPEST
jgi:hypothetical protein